MAYRAKRWTRNLCPLLVAGLVGASLTGCGKQADPATSSEKPAEAAVAATSSDMAVANTTPQTTAAGNDAASRDALHQSFAEATRRADDPPAECNRPPDETITNKSVYRLYAEVTRLWDTIRFVSPAGKRIDYTAKIETDFGVIEIALRPDLAPNHVRSFVALAQAGYYDGLRFDRIYHEESVSQPGTRLDDIEGGCPLGTGDPGNGSIGYWLKPEFSDKVSHEEGTVGACHGSEPDTAACRFYITLCKAPFLDGSYTVFGKVTKGLDVARTIFEQPVIIDDNDPDAHRRPNKPIVIRKVTIQAHETEAATGTS
jgi:cyclophilin family peptidyl-prolyl cis-trans isomerase